MRIRHVYLLIVESIFLQIILGCNPKCFNPSGSTISLIGGRSLYSPNKDSIMVGDTLILNITVPESLTYANTSSTIDFSSASNMKTGVRFTALKGFQVADDGLDSFALIKGIGTYSVNTLTPNAAIDASLYEQGGNYLFSIGCIAQKKGVYVVDVSEIPYAHKKCDFASISIVSNPANNHLHYLKDIYYGGGPIFPVDSTRSYCFKVY